MKSSHLNSRCGRHINKSGVMCNAGRREVAEEELRTPGPEMMHQRRLGCWMQLQRPTNQLVVGRSVRGGILWSPRRRGCRSISFQLRAGEIAGGEGRERGDLLAFPVGIPSKFLSEDRRDSRGGVQCLPCIQKKKPATSAQHIVDRSGLFFSDDSTNEFIGDGRSGLRLCGEVVRIRAQRELFR